MKFIGLLLSLVGTFCMGAAYAQVQKCIDSKGTVLYSQTPCPNNAAQEKRLKQQGSVTNGVNGGSDAGSSRDWSAENAAINSRQAQKERTENTNRAAISAFDRAVNAPLAPGERRTVTLRLPTQ